MVRGCGARSARPIPLARRPANWILADWQRASRARAIPRSELSGLRVFRRECVMQYFPVLSNKFSFTTTVTLALLADDYRVVYEPIDYYRRIGQSKITPRHFMDFTVLVLRMAMLFQPLRIFVPLAFLCGLSGLLRYSATHCPVPTQFERQLVVALPAALSTSGRSPPAGGVQLLLIGMVADGVLRRMAQHSRRPVVSHGVIRPEAYDPATDHTTRCRFSETRCRRSMT